MIRASIVRMSPNSLAPLLPFRTPTPDARFSPRASSGSLSAPSIPDLVRALGGRPVLVYGLPRGAATTNLARAPRHRLAPRRVLEAEGRTRHQKTDRKSVV